MKTKDRKPLGEWTPGIFSLLAPENLQDAKNCLPKTGGYEPMPGLSNINSEVLPFAPNGAIRARNDDGTNAFFAALEDAVTHNMELYQFKPTDIGGGVIEDRWVDVSNAAGYLSVLARRVEFAQFGTTIICASYTNDTQFLDMARDPTFVDASPTTPRASHVTTAENFLWLGDLYSRDAGSQRNAVQWSAVADPGNFPIPGTDAATAVLSGRQVLEGGGGIVQAVVSGSEVVAIFQETAIWRADFVGGDVVWDINNVEENVGLLIKGAAVAFGRHIFFIAEDGFRIFDYTASKNIGKDRVNDWFFDNYDVDFPDSVSIARDPKKTQIRMSFAGPGDAGVPSKFIVYDWDLDRFTYGEQTVYSMIGAGTTPDSLDSADVALDKDTLEDDLTGSGDLNYGILSFDDRQSGTGLREIGGFDSLFRLSRFSGTALSAVLETGDLELSPGRHSLLSGLKAGIRGTDITCQVAPVSEFENEVPTELDFGLEVHREQNGLFPFRIEAARHRIRFNCGKQWSEAAFYDPQFRPTGQR